MKCPKCGYLGFETSDRCRNCGYDFSLAVETAPSPDELPLRSIEDPGEPLADFELGEIDTGPRADEAGRLDLERVIGGPAPAASVAPSAPSAPDAPSAPSAPRRASGSPNRPAGAGARAVAPPGELPLFGGDDDAPLIAPRPVRPPLSVRRTTPEIPRVRPRPSTPSSRREEGELAFHIDGDPAPQMAPPVLSPGREVLLRPAPLAARLGATLIDVVILAVIDAVVVYLTFALAGVSWQDNAVLPRTPLVGFLALLNGGYLTVFIAAAGQTIGKMVTGVRVLRDDGQRVAMAGAVVRAAGCAVSLLTLGLGYLPAFVAADRRALHDRLAGTQVVRAS